MGETTIEWTNATWNPTRGCIKLSQGCKNCYAETFAERWEGIQGHPYELGFKPRLVPDKLGDPMSWRAPRRVFVNSMSDLFLDEVPNEYIAAVFGVMAACPQHTFQVLTKRAERMRQWFEWAEKRGNDGLSMFPDDPLAWRIGQMLAWTLRKTAGIDGQRPGTRTSGWKDFDPRRQPWPLPNVWMGVSVEDQKAADERIPELLATPAAVRFLSCEPLLGPVVLRESWLLGAFDRCPDETDDEDTDACNGCAGHTGPGGDHCGAVRGPRLSWVIVGSESGNGARPMQIEWARDIVEQCVSTHVAVFTKQIANAKDRKGGNPEHWPPGNWPRQYPTTQVTT